MAGDKPAGKGQGEVVTGDAKLLLVDEIEPLILTIRGKKIYWIETWRRYTACRPSG